MTGSSVKFSPFSSFSVILLCCFLIFKHIWQKCYWVLDDILSAFVYNAPSFSIDTFYNATWSLHHLSVLFLSPPTLLHDCASSYMNYKALKVISCLILVQLALTTEPRTVHRHLVKKINYPIIHFNKKSKCFCQI